MNLFDELKLKFRTGDIVTRLVLINCGVFVVSLLLDIIFTLFSYGEDKLAYTMLNFPWDPAVLMHKPWAVVTSMFTSWGLWHLLFNMVVLYWLGGIFLRFFTSNNMRGMYIMGGLSGMLVFIGIFMLFPSVDTKEWTGNMPLCSVCILAFSTAMAFRAPDYTEPIPLIGPVKLKYIVIALAIIDAAMLPHTSPASDAAHLGAAFTGWVFNSMLRKGRDITTPVTAIAVWLDKLISRSSRS